MNMRADSLPDGPICAFSAQHVCELTGLSDSQLRYWNKTGFFRPEAGPIRRGPYKRIYSFRDVVGLRTLALLRQNVSLQWLRRASEELHKYFKHPWSTLKFYTRGADVVFESERGGFISAGDAHQRAFDIQLQRVTDDMLAAVERLRERKKEEIGRISQHRYTVNNRPVIAGTRIPVSAIWEFHKAGYSEEQIMSEYPRLQPADVRAAIDLHKSEASTLARQ